MLHAVGVAALEPALGKRVAALDLERARAVEHGTPDLIHQTSLLAETDRLINQCESSIVSSLAAGDPIVDKGVGPGAQVVELFEQAQRAMTPVDRLLVSEHEHGEVAAIR